MAPSLRPSHPARRPQGGFSLIEVLIAAALMGLASIFLLGGILFGLKEARVGKVRAEATAWVQSEIDYLRAQGYAQLADDVAAGTRTLTASSGYTTFGSLTEPPIPAGFDRAAVLVENVSGLSLRKITVSIFQTSGPTPLLVMSTYVATFSFPL